MCAYLWIYGTSDAIQVCLCLVILEFKARWGLDAYTHLRTASFHHVEKLTSTAGIPLAEHQQPVLQIHLGYKINKT